jgi:alkylation response protein AidB-like acyl-CoA dehydrogenase
MNFSLTDDQEAIKRTAREFLAARYKPEEVRRLATEDERGFTDEQWSQIAELGWPGLVVSEEDGGHGLGMVELTIVQEELGYALAPSPFLSNVSAALLLAGASDAVRSEWLKPLAAGEKRGTVAAVNGDPGLTADGSKLSGTKVAVADAASADFIVVAAPGDEHFVAATDADGLTIEAAESLDPTRKLYTVRFEGVDGTPLGADAAAIERAQHAIAVAIAAESVGVAQRTLEMAVEYAKERKQFGRPIGAYQAVSHMCAQMLLETDGARGLTLYAAWALDHEPETAPLAASMAKAYASDAGWRVCTSALQVHGGIGFTWEHDLHFFLKRGKANAHAWGDSRWHRERVAELAGV